MTWAANGNVDPGPPTGRDAMNARTRPDAGHRGTMLILVLCASLVAVRVAGFEEDFEAAALTGWEFSGTPQLVRGVLGGPDNQAVELDQKPGTSIKRTDLQVAPGPDGVITVRWKFKYRWEAGHANIYVHFSQEPHPAQSLVWLYVPASTGNLGVHNYDGAKYARLNSCRADAEYEFIDILHTKDNRHDLIIVATGERGPRIVARHENLPLATTTAVWDPDQPLRRVSVGTGADGEEFSYWVDDIRVTAGAPGADQLPPRLTPVSYRQPPERLVWIEGETCTDHNWVEGPAYHCWTFGYHGIHGGVLDLATWQPPPPDGYTATFEVPVPEDERYTIYYLGRSVYLASPFSWRIDANPTQRYPPADGTFRSGVVAATSNQKYAVIRLGDVDLQAGPHTLRVTVSEPCADTSGSPHPRFSSAVRSRSSGANASDRLRWFPVMSRRRGTRSRVGEMAKAILRALPSLSLSSLDERVFRSSDDPASSVSMWIDCTGSMERVIPARSCDTGPSMVVTGSYDAPDPGPLSSGGTHS